MGDTSKPNYTSPQRSNIYLKLYLSIYKHDLRAGLKAIYSTGHFTMDFFFYKNSRLNQFVHLSINFFQYTDTEVRLDHCKTLNSSIFS